MGQKTVYMPTPVVFGKKVHGKLVHPEWRRLKKGPPKQEKTSTAVKCVYIKLLYVNTVIIHPMK
jgi:hypothetical protein